MKLLTLEDLISAHPLLFKGKVPRIMSHLSPGWSLLVDELCTKIETNLTGEALSRFHVDQIKEKFGKLRFYFSGLDHEESALVQTFVTEASAKSAETCDTCGAPAKLQMAGWSFTRCESCVEDRK